MKVPLIPQTLLSAVTPRSDYECIAGDLHEEYANLVRSYGRVHADRWYWSQVMRSIPALLASSRNDAANCRPAATWIKSACSLVTMLFFKDVLDRLFDVIHPDGPVRAPVYFILNWLIAAAAGALLASTVRDHPVRAAFFAAAALTAGFAVPILAGISSPLAPAAWLLLVGAVPAMCIGAATLHVIRQR